MRILPLVWTALCLWFPANQARATVAVMPLEAGESVPPEHRTAAEAGVVQGVSATMRDRVMPPKEVAALGCALPVCVARAVEVRFVIHMGVGSDHVLRADLYDARLKAVRSSDEEPLGVDAAQVTQAGYTLGARLAAAVQSVLGQEGGTQPAATPQPAPEAAPATPAPKPPKGITDADHPANSDNAAIAWKWLVSTMATFGGCACLSYIGSIASAACVALLGFMVCSTPGTASIPSDDGALVLCLLPCMPPVLAVLGCSLTVVTLGTPVVFLWRRVARWFSPATAASPAGAAPAAASIPAPWMPVGFDRLEE